MRAAPLYGAYELLAVTGNSSMRLTLFHLTALTALTACSDGKFKVSPRYGSTASKEVKLIIASPDRARLSEEELAKTNGYKIKAIPQEDSCAGGKIFEQVGEWLQDTLSIKLAPKCSYDIQVQLGQLDEADQFRAIYYTFTDAGESIQKERLTQASVVTLAVLLGVTAAGKDQGLKDTPPKNPNNQPGNQDGQGNEPPNVPQPPPETPIVTAGPWDRYEPDSDFHNMFGGVFWRIYDGYIEIKDAAKPMGSLTLVASCLQQFGASFDRWSEFTKIKVAQLYATAVTETGCKNLGWSSDGLSTGIMQVTGSTCASVMKKAGRSYTTSSCKSAMAANADFSIEVGARYMADPYQTNMNKFTPVRETRSDRGLALDPPKVTAGYNAGVHKKTTANRWHLHVTGDHIDRYVNAYNAFVSHEKNKMLGFVDESAAHALDLSDNPDLPVAVSSVSELSQYSATAQQGNSIFVGQWETRQGEFYFWFQGQWQPASGAW